MKLHNTKIDNKFQMSAQTKKIQASGTFESGKIYKLSMIFLRTYHQFPTTMGKNSS